MAREVCWSGNTSDFDANIGGCIISQDEGMSQCLHQLQLTGCGVRFSKEQRSVVVTNGDVLRTCSIGRAQGRNDGEDFEKHSCPRLEDEKPSQGSGGSRQVCIVEEEQGLCGGIRDF